MAVVSHYNVQPVIDIYGSVQGRDLGGVARDIEPIVDGGAARSCRAARRSVVRGQIETMTSSFVGLLAGLALAIVLVYLLIVVNFQSWLDPFIIISALPAALAGIVWILFLYAHDAQRAVADRRDHVHGRRDGEQHSGRQLREGRAGATGASAVDGGARRRLHALPARADDGAGDDHRHGADGARPRRRRRAERAARPRGHRRPGARDGRDAVLRAVGVCAAARHGRRRREDPHVRRNANVEP